MAITTILQKIFGSRNQRLLKRYQQQVIQINALESELSELQDHDLALKTEELRTHLNEDKTVTLDSILPQAFALVREAAKRTLNMRHFDVQLIGGMALHEGKIAEMRTGEGKTLVATLPAYLNTLYGKSVHIVTVNDYLAKRDAEWMRPVYEILGLTVGTILHGQDNAEKKAMYDCDIVYGTNNEFGFDYLRDNMALSRDKIMQRDLNYALVDEVDSILIDEARTPLIISGNGNESSELYVKINKIIPSLTIQQKSPNPDEESTSAGDVVIDEKDKQAYLTEQGHTTVEELLVKVGLLEADDSLYKPHNIKMMHHIIAALRAHYLFQCDVDYIVKDRQIIIVDEHTGRTMEGRRWSDGLHQAVEAKENVPIQEENQTMASITFQNYFRLYDKLAGMTGTADTEAYEFQQIYNLEVVVIPTNKPNLRIDGVDQVYLTLEEKFEAIIKDIQDCTTRKQPVLVGTVSIETSEFLSKLLNQRGIKHKVLNAKYHESEAQIVSEAGRPGSVTIATNMAGRGTDIVLGGNLKSELQQEVIKNGGAELDPETSQKIEAAWHARHEEVLAAGGLRIIGTERHESRRIDNQLRGRCARQGDPGCTQFYLSVKDNLMRIFISDNISAMLVRLGLEKGEAITHPWIGRAIENAQRKVEGHNFDIRKQLLEFDNVANDQRKVIYQKRRQLLELDDTQEITEMLNIMREPVVSDLVDLYIPPHSMQEDWEVAELEQILISEYGLNLPIQDWLTQDENILEDEIKQRILSAVQQEAERKRAIVGADDYARMEKMMLLQVLDIQWKDHLATMDALRQSIHLRGYAQKDPKQEYKREAYTMFNDLLQQIKQETVAVLARVQLQSPEDVAAFELEQQNQVIPDDVESNPLALGYDFTDGDLPDSSVIVNNAQQPILRDGPKIGRNAQCPCGSGRKYKQCHGQI